MFPEEMFGDVGFVSVGDAASVTEVVEFVLPHVVGETGLVVAEF